MFTIYTAFLGCQGAPDQPAPPAATAQQPSTAASALDSALAAQDSYTFNPIGKRDPFHYIWGTGCLDCTEGYAISDYQVKGVIWGIDAPRALVVDPAGESSVVMVGSYLGQSWGKVTVIDAQGVVVVQEFQTPELELVVQSTRLKLDG